MLLLLADPAPAASSLARTFSQSPLVTCSERREAYVSAQATKLYHMGFRCPVSRSALADANEGRHWRIYAEGDKRFLLGWAAATPSKNPNSSL